MEIQRIIQSEKTWSDMASIEGTEEMTEEQIRAMIDAMIDAAMMTEKKDLTKTLNYKTRVEESYFSHTRQESLETGATLPNNPSLMEKRRKN